LVGAREEKCPVIIALIPISKTMVKMRDDLNCHHNAPIKILLSTYFIWHLAGREDMPFRKILLVAIKIISHGHAWAQ
jgi:hypothetical protein